VFIIDLHPYFQEIQSLRQQIVSAEQNLRSTMSPAFFPQEREQQQERHQVSFIQNYLFSC